MRPPQFPLPRRHANSLPAGTKYIRASGVVWTLQELDGKGYQQGGHFYFFDDPKKRGYFVETRGLTVAERHAQILAARSPSTAAFDASDWKGC
jgi:hypothetical protein